jgi:GNAT superfamily N-acetyltransferase
MAGFVVRPMAQAELDPFLSATAAEYAEQKIAAGDWPSEGAWQRARRDADERLPEGVATPNMLLLTAVVASQPVGGTWLGRHSAERSSTAWLYEIYVHDEARGHGYGRALLAAAEDAARAAGYTSLGLNVFGHNRVARLLYESAGYGVRAMQLAKPLS